ncbi:MAG TPA: hypothetical protein DEQ80_08700 [Anaerolinea thermolimosa]|uniref:Uncharacterized protein n=1 Tax=Anaerolinea thermolimosa TaxID=229919 RepID=A0A3D1JHF5_9CHLR|nr:hypothetical protein ATHL_02588 [Anaerolinea thermolimosa]HCE17923.1 hypothetical protein [Anaerolinea thermolimosa]
MWEKVARSNQEEILAGSTIEEREAFIRGRLTTSLNLLTLCKPYATIFLVCLPGQSFTGEGSNHLHINRSAIGGTAVYVVVIWLSKTSISFSFSQEEKK